MLATVGTWVQYLGMAVAMAGGAPWPRPNWAVVTLGMIVIGAGVALKRAGDAREARAAARGLADGTAIRAGTIASASAALAAMAPRVKALEAEAATAPLEEVARAIEDIQREGTDAVAAAQDALVRAHSFAGYARVMAPLATGERLLYRAWSAASDGHRPEASASVTAAIPHVDAALEALRALAGEPGPAA